jgi:hypothetical protein
VRERERERERERRCLLCNIICCIEWAASAIGTYVRGDGTNSLSLSLSILPLFIFLHDGCRRILTANRNASQSEFIIGPTDDDDDDDDGSFHFKSHRAERQRILL